MSLILGLIILVLGAELLVKGASQLALSFGISSLVVGLTVVAFGTSAPELVVSALSSLRGQPELALGNVVGSNILNILLILGVSALIIPLSVHKQIVRLDVPLMIIASFAVWIMALNGKLDRVESALLLLALVAYTILQVRSARKEEASKNLELKQIPTQRWKQVVLILVGLAALLWGSHLFVGSAVEIAKKLGIPDLIIGLTIVAIGTSLPEIATSIVAAIKGERDIAVGNVVGSNIFNLLGVLGFSGSISQGGIAVPPAALNFDIPVMIAVAIATLPIFFTGHIIKRWEGFVFLFYYVLYTAFLVLESQEHVAMNDFKYAVSYFVVPLTFLTLIIGLTRSLIKGNPKADSLL